MEKTNLFSYILNALTKNFTFFFINKSIKIISPAIIFSTHKFIALLRNRNLSFLYLKIFLKLLIFIVAFYFSLFVNIFIMVLWLIFKVRFFLLKYFAISWYFLLLFFFAHLPISCLKLTLIAKCCLGWLEGYLNWLEGIYKLI